MRSAGTPASSTVSSRVNSETATTASAARNTRPRPTLPYRRCQRGNASGARRIARSCTVSTLGTAERGGPRKVVQWRRSTPAARAPDARSDTRTPSRTTLETRPGPPKLTSSSSTFWLSRNAPTRPRTCRAVPARVWTSGEMSTATFTSSAQRLERRRESSRTAGARARSRGRTSGGRRARRRASAPSRRGHRRGRRAR